MGNLFFSSSSSISLYKHYASFTHTHTTSSRPTLEFTMGLCRLKLPELPRGSASFWNCIVQHPNLCAAFTTECLLAWDWQSLTHHMSEMSWTRHAESPPLSFRILSNFLDVVSLSIKQRKMIIRRLQTSSLECCWTCTITGQYRGSSSDVLLIEQSKLIVPTKSIDRVRFVGPTFISCIIQPWILNTLTPSMDCFVLSC